MELSKTTKDSADFIGAIESHDLPALRTVPKADLHNHGGLGMRYQSLSQFAPWIEAPPPRFRGLPGFLDWTGTIMRPLSRDRELMPKLYHATIEDAIADGVAVLETSFDLGIGLHYGSAGQYARLVAEICSRYAGRITVKPEIGIKKVEIAQDRAAYVIELLESGVFKSIDLYGAEVGPWRLGKWRAIYAEARRLGVKPKAHFGEFERPLGLIGAAEKLGIRAIQHGISFAKSKRGLRWLAAERIACNVCPASNIALGAAADWRGHPMRRMFDAGVKVTLATDDLVAFGMSVSEQFLALHRHGIFSAAELDQIRLNGLSEGLGNHAN